MLGFALQSFIRVFLDQPAAVRGARLRAMLQDANPALVASVREALPPETAQAFGAFVAAAKEWK